MPRLRIPAVVVFAATALAATPSLASAWTLDRSFGGDGVVAIGNTVLPTAGYLTGSWVAKARVLPSGTTVVADDQFRVTRVGRSGAAVRSRICPINRRRWSGFLDAPWITGDGRVRGVNKTYSPDRSMLVGASRMCGADPRVGPGGERELALARGGNPLEREPPFSGRSANGYEVTAGRFGTLVHSRPFTEPAVRVRRFDSAGRSLGRRILRLSSRTAAVAAGANSTTLAVVLRRDRSVVGGGGYKLERYRADGSRDRRLAVAVSADAIEPLAGGVIRVGSMVVSRTGRLIGSGRTAASNGRHVVIATLTRQRPARLRIRRCRVSGERCTVSTVALPIAGTPRRPSVYLRAIAPGPAGRLVLVVSRVRFDFEVDRDDTAYTSEGRYLVRLRLSR